jgi:hypothetical protein
LSQLVSGPSGKKHVMVLLVTYDLEVTDDYEAVIDAIDRLGPAVEIQRSVWIVATELDAKSAFDHVAEELRSADRLFVGPLGYGCRWQTTLCGGEALKRVLAEGRA